MKYGTRQHCGGLEESLKTTKYITKEVFNRLLTHYEFYGIDERVNQILFINRYFSKPLPTWLFIEYES